MSAEMLRERLNILVQIWRITDEGDPDLEYTLETMLKDVDEILKDVDSIHCSNKCTDDFYNYISDSALYYRRFIYRTLKHIKDTKQKTITV